ncbi:MAG: LptF/LptG family permease [Bacteroidota bacterium]|nr:LptF/LptG family permease [Bacteroidota bacterium]
MILKKLDIYIARKFLGSVFFMLTITAIVSVVFDLSEKLNDFNLSHPTTKQIVFDYYLNFVPTIINLISSLVIFISALYFTSRLANQSEIIAILSSGISYYRFLRPYILVALLLACVDIGLKNYVFPKAYSKVLAFEDRFIVRGYQYSYKNIHRKLPNNQYFYAKSIDYSINRAYEFAFEEFDADGKLLSKTRAGEAFYDTVKHNWLVVNYLKRTYNGDAESISKGDSLRLNLKLSIKEFGQKIKSVPSMTTPELNAQIIEESDKGDDVMSYLQVEKFKRIAAPFDTVIMVVIAVALSSRKIRGGLGTHLLIGILIAVSHELFGRFSITFATNSNFPPQLAILIPTAVYGLIALVLLRVAQK